MTHKNPTDNELRALLNSARTIAVVGASSKPGRPSNEITRILIDARFDVIPVTPNETQVHGRRAYSSLADVPRPIDIVDVFRNADSALGLAKEAVQVGARVFWLQLGINSEEAAAIAKAGGLTVVMDMCIGQTVRRLGIKRDIQDFLEEDVDEALDESFPASDPPAWTPPGSAHSRH